jgi:cobyrinic acid a,c-diamide synthase
MTHIPRILISSDRSDSGKTLISSGLMRALSKRIKVRPFKAGPDFIDTGYHKIATRGIPSINLDLFIMGKENVINSLIKYSKGYDISIIEGVMGLYDGIGLDYSTYQLSEITKTPIILIINCENIGSTAGAIIKGLKDYGNAKITGVIFNKISSEGHFNYCKSSVKDTEVLGYIPFSKDVIVPSRHLGLYTTEDYNPEKAINTISKLLEEYVDIDKIMEIANSAEDLPEVNDLEIQDTEKKVAAIAYDAAFNFYYQENIDILKRKFQIKFFSPLNGETVEDPDLIYIGGGYPELYSKELESSITSSWIKKESYKGTKILAEYGGLMYTSKYIIGFDGKKYNMSNIFDLGISAKGKLTIGYTELLTLEDSILSKKGEKIRGHEFHISFPVEVKEEKFVFKNLRGKGIKDGYDGVKVQETLATYTHFHFASLQSSAF